MSDVFREVSFGFRDSTVTLVPSLVLLRRIKAKGVNNVRLANACIKGGVDLEDLTAALEAFLTEAGTPVPEDECYVWLSKGGAAVAAFQMAYVQAVLPGVDLGKKPGPRAAKTQGKTA